MSGVVDTSGFLVPVEVKDTPQYGHLIAFVLQGSLHELLFFSGYQTMQLWVFRPSKCRGVGGVGVGKYNDLTFRLEFTSIIFFGSWRLVAGENGWRNATLISLMFELMNQAMLHLNWT